MNVKEYNRRYKLGTAKEYLKEIKSNKRKKGLTPKEHRLKNTNKFYTVYYLLEDNYVGVTNNPKNMLSRHKFLGKVSINYEVIIDVSSRKEAYLIERKLHLMGYRGGNRFIY